MYNYPLDNNQQKTFKKIDPQIQYPKPPILYKMQNQVYAQPQNDEQDSKSIKPKSSQIASYNQPYLPNPEIDKIVSKYKSKQINETFINQYDCFIKDAKMQEPNSNNCYLSNDIIDNQIKSMDQNKDGILNSNQDKKIEIKNKDSKNDKIVKILIFGIIISQILYIISILNQN